MLYIVYTYNHYPRLVECWATVCDAGPAVNQHWAMITWDTPAGRISLLVESDIALHPHSKRRHGDAPGPGRQIWRPRQWQENTLFISGHSLVTWWSARENNDAKQIANDILWLTTDRTPQADREQRELKSGAASKTLAQISADVGSCPPSCAPPSPDD